MPNAADVTRSASDTVCAVICTWNRRALLLECLAALAAQTRPLARVIIVDNASSDGTLAAVAASPAAAMLDIGYIEMAENTGASGGFAEGVAQALREGHDWLWIIDNDCMPEPPALERLLDAPQAADPGTAALCTATKSVHGHFQTEYRGRYAHGQPRPLEAAAYREPAVRIDYAAFAGLLVRGRAAAAVGPPKAEFFLWVDDLEWCLRLRGEGALWLIPASVILHKDGNPQVPHGRLAYVKRSLRPQPDADIWKHVYCFRNMSWIRRHYDGEGWIGFTRHLLQHWVRVLLFDPHKRRRMRWYLEYGLAGRRGEFRNAPPDVWIRCASRPGGAEIIRRAGQPGVRMRRARGPFPPTRAPAPPR